MPKHYRVIVIGCGAIGAATAYWLSRRLLSDAVLALEQYQLGHGRGASEDHSRVIRHGLLYYGLPVYGEVAVKAGLDGAGPVVTPQTRTDTADPQRVAQVRAFPVSAFRADRPAITGAGRAPVRANSL